MRRRRSERRVARRRVLTLVAALGAAVVTSAAGAQTDEAGVSFLLVPVGARFVGVGGAGVADPAAPSSPFANPASLTRLTPRHGGLEYAQDALATRVIASAAVSSRVLGTAAVTGMLYNSGSQPITGEDGTVVGTLYPRNVVAAASYAVTFGRRLAAGLTYKYVQYRFDCTGLCSDLARSNRGTGAVDVGVQYDLGRDSSIHVGAAVRNLGLRLQIKDRAQSDPLPTQLALGASWDVPNIERYVPETSLRVLAEGTAGLGVRLESTYHVGAEAVYARRVALRAGYARLPGSDYGGPAVGFGIASKRLAFDVARQVTSTGLLADKPPTYAGLRYAF
jgi:hypothetical protein